MRTKRPLEYQWFSFLDMPTALLEQPTLAKSCQSASPGMERGVSGSARRRNDAMVHKNEELASVQAWTDHSAKVQKDYKGMLYSFAAILPCGGPALIRETERAIKQLGLKGIFISSAKTNQHHETVMIGQLVLVGVGNARPNVIYTYTGNDALVN
jgi:hypothetical protein